MRIRKRKNIVLQNLFLTILIIVPFTWVGVFGVETGEGWEQILDFQYEGDYDPDTEFLTANYTRLEEMAYVYDHLFQENHIPLNFSAFCRYTNDSYTEVAYYEFSDNGALWTGQAMAGWVYRYLTAKNEGNQTDVDYSLGVIKRLVHGLSMLVIVPNGGLGPDFPGILARGWAGPEHKAIAGWFFNEDFRHFNGTGEYSQYRWRGWTSNDEFGGYYLGLALPLKYVEDEYVQITVGLIVEQLANYMRETYWLGIHGNGGPTGVNEKPTFGSGGFWATTLLRMAAHVNPEVYEQTYYHWVASEMLYLSINEGHDGETVANYYAYNFGHCLILAFLEFEGTESKIGQLYYNAYLNSMRSYTYNHRNAWFNAIYLLLSKDSSEGSEIIERDIEDQLMRMDINHFPDRILNVTPVGPDEEIVEDIELFYNKTLEDPWGGLYGLPYIEMKLNEPYYQRAQTIEHHYTGYFTWQDNPFKPDSPGWYDPLYEGPGTTFSVPYWMMRYMQSAEVRNVYD